MRIEQILHNKGVDVVTVEPGATVRELVARLREYNLGALVVSSDGRSIDGIVSERDVVRHLAEDAAVLDRSVSTVMTAEVATCGPGDTLEGVARLMTDKRIRHLPVVVDGRLHGIVSIGDVVKTRIDELEFERGQLEGYITSGG